MTRRFVKAKIAFAKTAVMLTFMILIIPVMIQLIQTL